MRHRRRGRAREHRPDPDRGLRRLEYRGYDSGGLAVHQRRRCSAWSAPRAWPTWRRRPNATRIDRHHRHLAHALGDARRADVGQRASARQRRRDRGRAQRHHRELRGAARAAAAAGLRVRHPDRHRGHRAPDPCALRRRPARRRDQGGRRVPRRLRDRGDHHARAGARRRRAAGSPLLVGIGERRALPRLRRERAGAGHAARRLPRGRRRRRHRGATATRSTTAAGRASRAKW